MNKTLIQPIFTSPYLPNLLPQQVVLLDLDADEEVHLPLLFTIAAILVQIWHVKNIKDLAI